MTEDPIITFESDPSLPGFVITCSACAKRTEISTYDLRKQGLEFSLEGIQAAQRKHIARHREGGDLHLIEGAAT